MQSTAHPGAREIGCFRFRSLNSCRSRPRPTSEGRRHGENTAVNAGRPRVPFAADPAAGRGRLYEEPPSATRNDFRRDCDRIIHCTAFRRLAHKTQVFVYHEGDHYRTRLTHTLEVTQIARSLARALDLNEDLAEACALAHDLGHPPFGHSGERALDQCLARHGGFDHNAQTLAVVTRLERRYAAFDGLNLTYETLEGLVKHNGPLTDASGRAIGHHAARGVAQAILDYSAVQDLKLALYPSAEAQAGAIADDIAYDAHDIDDGLRARMFAIDELAALPLIADILAEIDRGACRHPSPPSLPSPASGGGKSGGKPSLTLPGLRGKDGWREGEGREGDLEPVRRAHELVRRLIARMIEDVISHSKRLIAERAPASVEDIRRAGAPVVAFSPAMAAADRAIKAFLFPRMYRHPRIMRIMSDAQSVVTDLFARYMGDPHDLPLRDAPADAPVGARQTADFIAGMTDRYALSEHARLFDSTPELR
jgi:dGTPase